MKTNKLVLAILMAACLPAMANPSPAPVALARARAVALASPLMVHEGKIVKNAPYSAQAISEKVQSLPDGNQITVRNTTTVYRDSAGRTRREMALPDGEVRNITIRDADGVTYVLRPRDKTATRIGAAREMAAAAREQARERIAQLRKEGKLPADAAGREAIIVKRIERATGEHGHGFGLGTAIAGAFGDREWSSKAVTRDLGTREFGAVKAEGKRRSYEIPAGELGNRNPIAVSQETWYSPELQVTVYTKHSDPRTGENTYRLENLKREEPAATLFAVPADYTVTDARVRMEMRKDENK
ncbi:hypothetical protein HHL21_16955 [Massilia sp. RP-1-19]|uniref:DUF4412 domain-containing protein n=1 Tax=Massilia polaris TaxID=2728846 RepID=A0A848HVH6_9BURK|nr:hypothetical protein [Massilia polaris]NML62738.1 hypothetical protein [Massilia polaris]